MMNIVYSFRKVVKTYRDSIALIYKDREFSFYELDLFSNRIASLLQSHDLKGKQVGIAMQRGPEWLAAMLGIWKAGAVYVPLDLGNPLQRLKHIIDDCKIELVLVCNIDDFQCDDVPVCVINEDLKVLENYEEEIPDEESLAFILYTSGTSGTPKGIPVCHRQAVEMSYWANKRHFYTSAGERMLQMGGLNFGASLVETLGNLLYGVCLVMATEEEKHDFCRLLELLKQKKVVSAVIPPALLAVMPKVELPYLKNLVVSGEGVSSDAKDFWMQGRRLINAYGFTENVILVTSGIYGKDTLVNDIGTAMPDTVIYVLDESLLPVPDGTPGELCVSGKRLALGYWERPELTAVKFIDNPFYVEGKGNRGETKLLYRSGDKVVRLPNGHFLYLGRIDNQIKIRGMRVEPGEIEQYLNTYPGVSASVVLLKEHDERQVLVAYLQTENQIEREKLAKYVAERLPDYMCPTMFVCLEKFPMTLNRKTDKNSLPEPDWNSSVLLHEAPLTLTEKKIANLWCSMLKLPHVNRTDNFIALGGDSISVMSMIDELDKIFEIELHVEDVFNRLDLLSLAVFVDSLLNKKQNESQVAVDNINELPLELYNLWLECMSSKTMNESYKLAVIIPWEDSLDVNLLQKAWNRIIQEQDALRMSFGEIRNGSLQMFIAASDLIEYSMEVIHTDNFFADAYKLYQEPLYPDQYPLHHEKLYRLSDGTFRLVIIIHHLISDGWSLRLLSRMVHDYYQQEKSGKYVQLSDCNYKDYISWCQEQMQEQIVSPKLDFWKSYLSGCMNLSWNMKIDSLPKETQQGRAVSFLMNEESAEMLGNFCRNYATTPLAVCLVVYQLLLMKYSGQDDFAIGMAVTNRRKSEFRSLLGYLATLLPLRVGKGSYSFKRMVQETMKDIVSLLNNTLPFNLIHDCWASVNVGHEKSDRLVRFAFGLEKISSLLMVPDDWVTAASFDLSLIIYQDGSRYVYHYQYATEYFDVAFLKQFSESFDTALLYLTKHADSNVTDCPLLTEEKIRQIISDFHFNELSLPSHNVIEEFERIVMDNPRLESFYWNGLRVSYGELNSASDKIATVIRHKLMQINNNQRSVPVGLYLQEKKYLLPCMLGILKSGGCYVPLDASLPEERLRFIIDDSGVSLILSDTSINKFKRETINIDEALKDSSSWEAYKPVECLPEDIVYIIYTSGTTGKPKGIPVKYSSLALYIQSQIKIFDLHSGMRVLQYANTGFDASILEIFPALLSQATLVIPTEIERKDSDLLINLIEEEKVNCALIPPALLVHLTVSHLPEFKVLAVGGESTPLEVMRKWAVGRRVINEYGPTENTVVTTYTEYKAQDEANNIGLPLPGVSCYVLNKDLNLMPDGVPGELYIGGLQLTDGYIRQTDLNKEKFIENPYVFFDDKAKNINTYLYKSGDLVKRNPDGHLTFVGRIDNQVKIHGFRIELGEIETCLNQHVTVERSVVVARDLEGDRRLVAYIQTCSDVSISTLRKYLEEYLPYYMIPSSWVFMESLPMTANGKLDIRSLPMPQIQEVTSCIVAPVTPDECILASVISSVCGIDNADVEINLFDLGLTSIQVMMIVSGASSLGLELSASAFYRYRTIREIAKHKDVSICFWHHEDNDKPIAVIVCGDTYFAPDYIQLADKLSDKYSVLVLESYHEYLLGNATTDWEQVLEAYLSIMQKVLDGRAPQLLSGFCLGGEMALGMASLLEKQSIQPDLLLIDSFVNRDKGLPIAMDYPGTSEIVNARRQEETNRLLQTQKLSSYEGDICIILANRFTTERMQLNDEALVAARRQFEENPVEWKRLYPQSSIEWRNAIHWDILKNL